MKLRNCVTVDGAAGDQSAWWAPRPRLAEYVSCVWARQSPLAETLLPDAAVELVWSGRGLFVRGADTRPHPVGAFPDRTFVALRFRPGAVASVLGLRGRAVTNARVGISELWGQSEMERLEALLATSSSPRQAAVVLEEAVSARLRRPPDHVMRILVAALERERAPRVGP